MQYFGHLSHLYQTVGAGICGFRNNTIEEDPSSKYFMFSCICLTNVLSHEFNQHYGTHSYTTQLVAFQVHYATEELFCTGTEHQ